MKLFIRSITLITCLGIFSSSCTERHKIRKVFNDFTESEIVIPNDLEYVYNGQTGKICIDTLKPLKFIVYYDSLECSACASANLVKLQPIYDKFNDMKVEVMTIFSPKREEIENVRMELLMADLRYTIYIDVNGTFARINTLIPADDRFSYFMINESGKPIFVGNPVGNIQLMKILDSVLQII